jgi:predicted AAA+ superfamily ATPase
VVRSAFGRLSGDKSFPLAQHLETAFGGGKTPTLIALARLATHGRDLTVMELLLFDLPIDHFSIPYHSFGVESH